MVIMHDNGVDTIPYFNSHSSSKITLMEIMMNMIMVLMMMLITMVSLKVDKKLTHIRGSISLVRNIGLGQFPLPHPNSPYLT